MINLKKSPVRKSLILLFAMTATTLFSGCEKKEGPVNGLGLQLYSVRDDMHANPDSTIRLIGKIGYNFVEAAGYADGKFYNMEPEAFRNLVESNGMQFLGSHCGQAVPDSLNWDSIMEWWDECIAAHKKAGVKYIVQPFMDNVGYESLEGLQRYCEYFNMVGQKCNDAGIRFGYHNHNREFDTLQGTVIYDYLLQNTDPEKVMFQLDLYWIMEGGANTVEYLEKYPGRFGSYHIKDEMELGESGKMDFQPAFDLAATAGVQYFVVEVERYSLPPVESVTKSYEYLKNIGFIN